MYLKATDGGHSISWPTLRFYWIHSIHFWVIHIWVFIILEAYPYNPLSLWWYGVTIPFLYPSVYPPLGRGFCIGQWRLGEGIYICWHLYTILSLLLYWHLLLLLYYIPGTFRWSYFSASLLFILFLLLSRTSQTLLPGRSPGQEVLVWQNC